VVFEDITQPAGLSGWRHKMGVPEKNFIVETNGSGVADYDNDGCPISSWATTAKTVSTKITMTAPLPTSPKRPV
jgi:hypothetical protein